MIAILGAGAFGTALAVALAHGGRDVTLWSRDRAKADDIHRSRKNPDKLGDILLPPGVTVTSDFADLAPARALLLALPMQALSGLLTQLPDSFDTIPMVACCKGVDLTTLEGPASLIRNRRPRASASVLTGPSFAFDIARGLPTALTVAGTKTDLQGLLSTPSLRLYLTDDVIGAELGGALKNVIAIAAGVVIGAGLGHSARAAVMTRGFAEISRFAVQRGARPETLQGLSGFGDLVLTCTSNQSRNFQFGQSLGAGQDFDGKTTVEGKATALAVTRLAQKHQIDMPITEMVAALVQGRETVQTAVKSLLSRPLKQE